MGGRFIGAAFLMATSAIGPGFITQTTVFTSQLGAALGFVILVSILIDIVVQLTIWRTIAASGQKAPALANAVLPGAGNLLSILVFAGGMVFNVGNIAGCGLGWQALTGLSPTSGALLSGILAMLIFFVKEFGKAMDGFAKWLGLLMIAMVLWVAFQSGPPVAIMVKETMWPSQVHWLAILTLVGGTVGGYISFAGAHRMLDASLPGKPAMKEVNRSATAGIMLSGIMRIGLFAAAFGVIASGFVPDAANPAASIFKAALGTGGEKMFGFILWCAAITSVVGASYTSISFLESWHPAIQHYRHWWMAAFIITSTLIFSIFGQPVKVLVAAGAINALVLPFSLVLILLAAGNKFIIPHYQPNKWLSMAAWLVTALVSFMCYRALADFFVS